MKKVRFSTKRLHISAFLPIFTQNLRMSDYGNKHSVFGTGDRSVSPVPRNESDFWQYIDAIKEFVEKD